MASHALLALRRWHLQCDADGNHDDIDESDLPTDQEVVNAWKAYSAYVSQTGRDPLGEFLVKTTLKQEEAWRFQFRPSILGACVVRAQRGRVEHDPRDLPEHVAQFLNTKKGSPALQDFPTWPAFEEQFPDYKPGTWKTFQIEHTVVRKPDTVSKELRQAARKRLREHRISINV